MTNPCENCQEMESGCHTRCPYGIAWDMQQRARKDKIRAAKANDKDYSGFKVQTVERTKRIVGR